MFRHLYILLLFISCCNALYEITITRPAPMKRIPYLPQSWSDKLYNYDQHLFNKVFTTLSSEDIIDLTFYKHSLYRGALYFGTPP